MANVLQFTPERGWTLNGAPLANAKALFFETGTSTPVTVYSDAALTSALVQPVLADGNGVFAPVYDSGAVSVRAVIRDSSDVEISDIDPIASVALASSGASNLTFAPTTDIPVDDVQEAIERVDANWRNAKTGSDDGVVSGTAGSNTTLGHWNADGDLIGTNWTIPATVSAGDIFIASADNTMTALAKGTQFQTLTMNAGATAPEWGAGAAVTRNQITNEAETAFTWVGSPRRVEFRLREFSPAADGATLQAQLSDDAGATSLDSAGTYLHYTLGLLAGSTNVSSSSSASDTKFALSGSVGNNGEEAGVSGLITLLRPNETDFTSVISRTQSLTDAGVLFVASTHAQLLTPQAVNGIRFYFSSGNASGEIEMEVTY